jgi:site-specific DNA-methyltransferase (adenine-specific)
MELPEWFIRLFTKPGDIVCDPFLGSGTSCLAAQELGRSSIGIEIDENYFRLAQERLSKSETS